MARVLLVSFFDEMASAVRYLAASLNEAGHEVELLFLSVFAAAEEAAAASSDCQLVHPYPLPVTRPEMELLIEEADRFGPDLVGMTVVSSFFDMAATATEWIHRHLGLPVVWGGPEPSVNPEAALQHADIICVGDGERAVVQLASVFDVFDHSPRAGREKLSAIDKPIRNLRIKRREGVLRGEEWYLCQDLDRVPFPLFDLFREVYIVGGQVIRGKWPPHCRLPATIPVICSRGCPFHCSYCCHAIQKRLYRGGTYFRRRSPENVVAELAGLKTRFPELSMVEIYDSVFTVDEAWLYRFADLYGRHIRIPFWCHTYPGMVKESVLRRLREIGLDSVVFGIQSGSDRIRREVYDRVSSREKILATAHLFHRLQIPYVVDIIGSNPFETDEDRLASVVLLAELPKPYFLHRVSPLSFFPGYMITEKAMRAGIRLVKSHGSTMLAPSSPRLFSWDALMILAQFAGVTGEALRALSRNNALMSDPSTLCNLALAMTKATYHGERVYDLNRGDIEPVRRITKDERIRELETELGSLNGSRLVRAGIWLRRRLRSLRRTSSWESGLSSAAYY